MPQSVQRLADYQVDAGGHTAPAETGVVTSTALDTSGSGLFNSSQTMALFFSTTPITSGMDLDTNNDGVLDLPAGVELVDVVGWLNPANATDVVYGGVSLTQTSVRPMLPRALSTIRHDECRSLVQRRLV